MATVSDILRTDFLALAPSAKLETGIEALEQRGCHGALVIDDEGRLQGMFSDATLLDVVFDVSSRNSPISDFMARTVHVVAPDDSLELAAQMFELYGVAQLPVLAGERVIGTVTRRDLVRHVLEQNESLKCPLASWIHGLPELVH